MLKRIGRTAIFVVMFVCIGFFTFSSTASAKSQLMRLQCVYPEGSFGGMLTKAFAEKVEKYTDGQVKVKVFWPGQLVKVGDSYNSLSKGIIQGLAAASVYFGGIVPEVKTEMMPFAWKSGKAALELYYEKGMLDILRDVHLKKGVVFEGPVFAGSMVFLTKFPVKTIEDFKGKKIRSLSAYADVVKKLGAVPTPMANTEQYMALKTGVVDGTVFPPDCIETFKFNEVTDTVVLPGIITPVVMGFYLSNKWYSKLSPKLQKAIDKACYDTAKESVPWSDKRDKGGLDFAKKVNMTIVTLPDKDVRTLQELAMEGWDEIGALSPTSKKLVDLIKENAKN